ncbi:4-phosphoerythronate dehydrogenase PdxB [uncultured Draconibacterium sp.]|uniref:4-phosphoerythronate dehydrogenase PdxB n=1 Tax=uncultured Draconibacterium sp. TaxID=1573823 RepID=UPI0025DA4466|nr:4-phosphoerythronate dehydrogenase PdxB [uncultured Draconibacterium sp.]
MKIVIDNKIPYIKGALEPFAEVVYLPGNLTTPDVVKDADALITRTRTICNRKLLAGSKVKFIATATIGFDHIDTDYCEEAGIKWTNAPGCNAESVNQYIASALFSWSMRKRVDLASLTIGIIGVGNVGKRVEKTCRTLGMNVLLNDPPRERVEGKQYFTSLETIKREADIITFHVPLNESGKDATYHLANEEFLQSLTKKPLIINSCRGEVTDNEAIYNAIEANDIDGFIVDCWENEPDISLDLLNLSDFGTPHIAGYSKDGKANGTKMSVQALSKFFGLGIDNWEPQEIEKPTNTTIEINGNQRREYSILAEAILSTYDIENDDDNLREAPLKFEQLRGDYPVRREFATYSVKADNINNDTLNKLKNLGFSIAE